MAIQERYSETGVLAGVFESKAVEQQQVHQELVFNMGKMEGLMNLLAVCTPRLATLKAEYKAERAKFVERQLAAKVPKTRADILADAHFEDEIKEISELEAEIDLYKTAMGMRKSILDTFRTLSSDIRSYES